MPVHRPGTNPVGKGKAGSEYKLAEVRNEHHTLQYVTFPNDHGLWPIAFLHLEAIGEARLGECDLSAGGGVLRTWPNARKPYGQ